MDSPRCQNLSFARPFSPTNFVLLEVDKSLADVFLSSDSPLLTVRGHSSDSLVLCTPSHTFGAKDVEVSNTLLLLDGPPKGDDEGEGGHSNQIVSITNHFIELSPLFPSQTFRLMALLEQNLFDFYDENAQLAGINFNELLDQVQLSEQQLKNALDQLPVVQSVEGTFHLLSDACQQKFLDELVELFDAADENGLAISAFSADSLRQKVSAQVTDIDWFLRLFCQQNDNDTYCVSDSAFVRCRAKSVLSSSSDCSKQLRVVDFEQFVLRLLPDAFRHLSPANFLDGIALLSESLVYGKTIRALLPDTLPRELGPRLAHLFTLKTAWKRDELRHYIMDFCPNPAKMDELLLKYCKVVGNGTERVYIYRRI